VLTDTREKRPWTFDGVPVETRTETLSTGDYALSSHCEYDPEADTYHPRFAVERKSGGDFLTAITWDRERFCAELSRAREWAEPLCVVVETPLATLVAGRGCARDREVHPNQILGTLAAWHQQYNVRFVFAESRGRAERTGLLLLERHRLRRVAGEREPD
jgi:ERCC4-type nuclease